ncbi:putative zinc-binding protein [Methanolobus profundi]|nr:putative zinc-binding protein [Methanolobus profundi]
MQKHILLTDMDIKKNKDLDLDPAQVKEVLSKVTELL